MRVQQLSAVAIDLTRLNRRTVTSFYSNLVTRPTGRAVRMGVEQQLMEVAGQGGGCISILDFSQVRVMDYSCADEIVAKLLLRYSAADRPVDAYFLARGLHEHHLESVEAVLERHALLLVAEVPDGHARLLGPCTPVEHMCWRYLLERGGARLDDLAQASGMVNEALGPAIRRFLERRVALPLAGDTICPLPRMSDG